MSDDWTVDSDNGDRSGTMTRWLANHPQVVRWIIVDDSQSNLTDDQMHRLVQPDMHFGFGFADLHRGKRLLGLDVGDPNSFANRDDDGQMPRHTIANQMRAAIAALEQGDPDSALAIMVQVRDCPLAQ